MKKRFSFALGLIPFGVALGVQAILVLSARYVEYDEAIFLDVARNLTRQGRLVRSIGTGALFFDHTPLYSYFLGLSYNLFGDRVLIHRLTTLSFSIACLVLVYVIVSEVRTPVAGMVSVLLLGVNPFFAVYSYFVRMEVPMVFFILLSIYAVWRWELKRQWYLLLLGGMAAAVAVLLKEIAMIYCGAAALYLMLRPNRWQMRIVAALVLVIPSLVGLLAWGWIAWSMSPEGTSAMVNRWTHALTGVGSSNEGRIAIGIGTWLQSLGDTVLGWALMALLLASIVWMLVRRDARKPIAGILALYILVSVIASVLIRLKEPRYVIGLVPAACMVVGIGPDWEFIVQWLRTARRGWLGVLGALVFLVSLSPLRLLPGSGSGLERWVDSTFYFRAVSSDRYHGALATIGGYLRDNTPPDSVIVVIHEGPVVGYYADRSYMMLYTLPLEGVLEVLDRTEYLVYDHVVFPALSESEVRQVLDYIDRDFEVEHEVWDAYRRVVVLRRAEQNP